MCHLTLTLTFSLLALINLHQFFMLGSLSPLPYNVGSSYILYLIHIFIMVFTCQSGICHLTLTSFSWSTDFIKFTSSFQYGVTFSTPYNLGSPCLVQTFIMEGTAKLNINLTKSADWKWGEGHGEPRWYGTYSGETDLIMFNNTGRLKMRSKIGDTCKSDRYLPW
jgi:hypothetical protein